MGTSKSNPKVNAASGEFITLKEVIGKQTKHLSFRKDILKENEPMRSQFFGREKVEELLKKEGCVGLKIILGVGEANMPSLVLVGADEFLNNLATDSTGLKDGGRSYLSNGPECPNTCN
jgi:hypothetical protein